MTKGRSGSKISRPVSIGTSTSVGGHWVVAEQEGVECIGPEITGGYEQVFMFSHVSKRESYALVDFCFIPDSSIGIGHSHLPVSPSWYQAWPRSETLAPISYMHGSMLVREPTDF
jgi:hypothetical protein